MFKKLSLACESCGPPDSHPVIIRPSGSTTVHNRGGILRGSSGYSSVHRAEVRVEDVGS